MKIMNQQQAMVAAMSATLPPIFEDNFVYQWEDEMSIDASDFLSYNGSYGIKEPYVVYEFLFRVQKHEGCMVVRTFQLMHRRNGLMGYDRFKIVEYSQHWLVGGETIVMSKKMNTSAHLYSPIHGNSKLLFRKKHDLPQSAPFCDLPILRVDCNVEPNEFLQLRSLVQQCTAEVNKTYYRGVDVLDNDMSEFLCKLYNQFFNDILRHLHLSR